MPIMCCWLTLVTPVAILTGAAIAWCAQKGIARRRAAVDFIAQQELGNPEWAKARRVFARVTRSPDDAAKAETLLAHPPKLTSGQLEERFAIVAVLEHYEAAAVAIKHEIIDEAIYRECSRSAYVEAWRRAKPLVHEWRRQRRQPSLYEHFEKRAEEWARDKELDCQPGEPSDS